jgi:hypothetical protein
MRAVIRIYFLQQVFQLLIQVLITEVSGQVIHAVFKPRLYVGIERNVGKLVEILLELGAKFLGRHGIVRDSHHRKLTGEKMILAEVVEGRNQLAAREVARGSEDDHDTGIAGAADPLSICVCLRCESHNEVSFKIVKSVTSARLAFVLRMGTSL